MGNSVAKPIFIAYAPILWNMQQDVTRIKPEDLVPGSWYQVLHKSLVTV